MKQYIISFLLFFAVSPVFFAVSPAYGEDSGDDNDVNDKDTIVLKHGSDTGIDAVLDASGVSVSTFEDEQHKDINDLAEFEPEASPKQSFFELQSDSDLLDSDSGSDSDSANILEIMKREAVEKNSSGLKLLKKKKIPEALSLFKEAFELDSENAEIINNLAYAYYLLGSYDEAEKYYLKTIELDSTRVVAFINLADLLSISASENKEAGSRAFSYLVKARELEGNTPRIILRQARVEVARLNFVSAERFYREYLKIRKPSNVLKLELGDFYRDIGRLDQAIGWYKSIKRGHFKQKAHDRIWNIEVQKQSVSFGWSPPEVPQKAKELLRSGRKLFIKHKYHRSERLYKRALFIAPAYPEAMSAYGDLLYRTGRRAKAELYYLRALSLLKEDPDIYFRLARMYLTNIGTDKKEIKQASAAVLFLRRALELRPQWNELELELALALRQTGDVSDALVHVKKFLASVGGETHKKDRALKLKRSLEMLISPAELANLDFNDDSFMGNKDNMPQELIEGLQKARAHLKNGQLDSAMAALEVIPDKLKNTTVINLEGRILLGAGKTVEAVHFLKKSLLKDEKQPVIHEQLGLALITLGNFNDAKLHFERARELGDEDATYQLIKLVTGTHKGELFLLLHDLKNIRKLINARDSLRRFIVNNHQSVYRSEARSLATAINKRVKNVAYLFFSFMAIVLLIVIVIIYRIWGGINLKRLILDYPDAGIQIQRVLSAVRHEVLKHNTMMLKGLVDAMEQGEDVAERMAHVSRRISGGDSGGVSAKLLYYVKQLEQIGDAHKRRLNLKRKDSAVSPLLKGMALVVSSSSLMENFDKLGGSSKKRVLRRLRRASLMLNVEGYEAVRALLDNLRILNVDSDLMKSIFNRCIMESSFAGYNIAPVQIDINPNINSTIKVAVPRSAFEDIVTNLVRNAIQSSILYGDSFTGIDIGLELDIEIDMVTGFERLIVYVKDKAKREITAEMLRGRYIEEGLGLTADLITMYDGTLDVIHLDKPWIKAVIVKLPIADVNENMEVL